MTTSAISSTAFERQVDDLRSGDFAELQPLIEDVDRYYSALNRTVGGSGAINLESMPKWPRAMLRLQVDEAVRQRADASLLRAMFATAGKKTEQDLLAAAADGLIVHGVPSTISGGVFDAVDLAARLSAEALSPEFESLLLPVVARSVGAVDLDGPAESMYDHKLPLLLFLNMTKLNAHPEYLLEALLHEALHVVFFDVVLVRGIMPPGYRQGTGLSVRIPWGAKGRLMDALRVTQTLHVYSYIALMYADMLRVGKRDYDETMSLLLATMTRANFFVAAGNHLRSDMTADGAAMFDMLVRPYEFIGQDVLGHQFTPESFPMDFYLGERLVESLTS